MREFICIVCRDDLDIFSDLSELSSLSSSSEDSNSDDRS